MEWLGECVGGCCERSVGVFLVEEEEYTYNYLVVMYDNEEKEKEEHIKGTVES